MISPRAVVVGVFVGLLAICQASSAQEVAVPSGVKYQLIGTYDVARLNKILTSELAGTSSFPVTFPQARYPVKLYRVTYPSVIPERNNKPTVASGLIAIPDTGSNGMPVVSYQHGTVFSKTQVPSRPEESMETRLMVALFAGQGYIVVAADYFGKGDSIEPDSYLVKASTQQACIDMLHAARAVSNDLKLWWLQVFVSGWSQGGYSTMVFLNRLESDGFGVAAAATACSPNDLFAIINGWLHAPSDDDAVYLPGLMALLINSYAEYYGLPGLDEAAFKPEYRQTARDLYLNKITWEEAAPKLPKKIGDLLREDFIAEGSLAENRFWQTLQDNQAYRWRSKTPLRTYYGDIDEVVSPYIATLPVDYQKAVGGAQTTGVAAGAKANHRGTFLFAIGEQKKWFDQIFAERVR